LIVIDASILANVIGDDAGDGHRARQEFRTADSVAAPDLVDVETTAVLRKRWLAGSITDQRFADAVTDLADLDFDRYPTLPFMARAYHLRANVTAYDAAYVAVSRRHGWQLVSLDIRDLVSKGLAVTPDAGDYP